MPSDETRRVLRTFGVAVTNLEDAIARQAAPDEIERFDTQLAERMREVTELVERLRRGGAS